MIASSSGSAPFSQISGSSAGPSDPTPFSSFNEISAHDHINQHHSRFHQSYLHLLQRPISLRQDVALPFSPHSWTKNLNSHRRFLLHLRDVKNESHHTLHIKLAAGHHTSNSQTSSSSSRYFVMLPINFHAVVYHNMRVKIKIQNETSWRIRNL